MADADASSLSDSLKKLSVAGIDHEATALSRNVESTELTKLDMHETLGRIVRTKAPVDIGHILIRESPVLVWRSSSWSDYLSKFAALPKESRESVLDMFHPPLESEPMKTLGNLAVILQFQSSLDYNTIHKLLAISETNAHEYYGKPSTQFTEIIGVQPEAIRSGLSALFLFGSKVAHDCNPNASYSSKTSDGKLEYKAIRPLAEGEMVTFSYLRKVYETPTHMRRRKLLETKSFLCKCDRCMGPDYARQIRCPNKQCPNFISCTTDGTQDPVWSCQKCGTIDNVHAELEARETSMRKKISEIESTLMVNCLSAPFSRVQHLFNAVSKELGPLHFLSLEVMDMHSRLAASQAAQIQMAPSKGRHPSVLAKLKKDFGSPELLRLQSARVGLSAVSACECIAAGCDGDSCNNIEAESNHEPIFDKTQIVYFATQDLMKCGEHWPVFAVRMVERYLPMMVIWLGETDADVKKIAETVGALKIKGAASKPVSSNRSSKKKSGRGNKKKKNRRR